LSYQWKIDVSNRGNIIDSNIANSIIDFIGNVFGESMETKWFWLKCDRTFVSNYLILMTCNKRNQRVSVLLFVLLTIFDYRVIRYIESLRKWKRINSNATKCMQQQMKRWKTVLKRMGQDCFHVSARLTNFLESENVNVYTFKWKKITISFYLTWIYCVLYFVWIC